MKAYTCVICLIFAAPSLVHAAGSIAETPSQPTRRVIKLKHLQVDLENRCIVLESAVCLRSGPLEFLICKAETKEHESILRTHAAAADLHAAFLALDLTPGKPARWSGQDENAVFLPPQGPAVKIALRWRDEGGKIHQLDAGQWLTQTTGRKRPPPKWWIFVGSEIFPDGGYWADLEGGVVSVANFASSVLDVPFESSSSNEMLDFRTDTKAIPPLGTKVRVIFEPLEGASKADHARVLLEIDRRGELRIEGRHIAFNHLRGWAEEYLTNHAKGQVVLRADGRALAWDIERVRRELRVGGVREFEEQRAEPLNSILPRTPAQASASLKTWTRKFASPEEHLQEPSAEAETLLRQIDRRIRELEALKALWGEYASHLRKALKQYKTATQPADDKPTCR